MERSRGVDFDDGKTTDMSHGLEGSDRKFGKASPLGRFWEHKERLLSETVLSTSLWLCNSASLVKHWPTWLLQQQSCYEGGVGLDDLQRSVPTLISLICGCLLLWNLFLWVNYCCCYRCVAIPGKMQQIKQTVEHRKNELQNLEIFTLIAGVFMPYFLYQKRR